MPLRPSNWQLPTSEAKSSMDIALLPGRGVIEALVAPHGDIGHAMLPVYRSQISHDPSRFDLDHRTVVNWPPTETISPISGT